MSEHSQDRAEQLVKMANDIGNFFRFEPVREDAIAGIAKHITAYWTNSMLRKMAAHGEAGLDDLPREAFRRLASRRAAVPVPAPGGDTG
jgi:formate dehydrogenase subunit delta